MSAAADKARYFLEQSVPELKELERKKVFTQEEITAIAKKRSDFEHKINARGPSPADYAQYAEFEINVDQLRKKRVKRLGLRMGTTHHGQRRIFFVFDRGVRKFPGDLRLWMQGIEYARSQKALKKVTQMLTNALRLHPTKVELWIYAAQFALEENGDMTEARGYMQRGLRFCKHSRQMWLQNFRLEISWIAKIHARRRVLGLEQDTRKEEETKIVGGDDPIMLPTLTAEDIAPEEDGHKVDVTALAKLDSTPATAGALPIAIFDAAMNQFQDDPNLALQFYEETGAFEEMPAMTLINHHIDAALQRANSASWQACACHIAQATRYVQPDSPEFPAAIREALLRIAKALAETKQHQDLLPWCRAYLEGLLHGGLDPAIEQVLQSKLHSLA